VKCLECRGACCESFSIPLSDIRPPGADERRWIELHGKKGATHLEIEAPCTNLTADGRCCDYENRPLVCVFYMPGSPHCLDTVRKRRTPEQYQRIREAHDPKEIHGVVG
jgi:Fe-S-cluster containining protein